MGTAQESKNIQHFVPETTFGFWFLGTRLWQKEVLRIAIDDLKSLIDRPETSCPVLLDVGCGQGLSFKFLAEAFKPHKIVAIDFEEAALAKARQEVEKNKLNVDLLQQDCADLKMPDCSVDLIFCHQTFHHLVRQDEALIEFFRALKPGGLLLFAESTKAYIESWIIQLLFAHPKYSQRTAQQYVKMIQQAGFEIIEQNISYPYLWWSRPDFGLLELMGVKPKPVGLREETLINLVARKK